MKQNHKTKKVEFSPAEQLMIDKIYDDMAKAFLEVMKKYMASPENTIPVFMALCKMMDKFQLTFNHMESVVCGATEYNERVAQNKKNKNRKPVEYDENYR